MAEIFSVGVFAGFEIRRKLQGEFEIVAPALTVAARPAQATPGGRSGPSSDGDIAGGAFEPFDFTRDLHVAPAFGSSLIGAGASRLHGQRIDHRESPALACRPRPRPCARSRLSSSALKAIWCGISGNSAGTTDGELHIVLRFLRRFVRRLFRGLQRGLRGFHFLLQRFGGGLVLVGRGSFLRGGERRLGGRDGVEGGLRVLVLVDQDGFFLAEVQRIVHDALGESPRLAGEQREPHRAVVPGRTAARHRQGQLAAKRDFLVRRRRAPTGGKGDVRFRGAGQREIIRQPRLELAELDAVKAGQRFAILPAALEAGDERRASPRRLESVSSVAVAWAGTVWPETFTPSGR